MSRYKHVFDGVTVLDFTQMLAGPVGTRAMAEMGARVIKVEALGGDNSRQFPYKRDGRSAYFVQQNRGKEGLCINLKAAEGKALVHELVRDADVLVENFTPGTIGRLGFGYDAVKEINPRIVMCSISAFGQDGPLSDRPGYDYIAQAYSGVTSMIGHPGETPALVGLAAGDVMTGMHALAAVAAALFHRERTGEGQHVDVSLLETYMHCHEVNVQINSASDGETKPTRSGSQHPQVAPVGIFSARDGHIFIAVASDHQWPPCCLAMGREDLATDARFVSSPDRFANREAVFEAIDAWLADLDVAEAVTLLEAQRVPVAPVLSVEEAVNHPHMRQRGSVQTVSDRLLGEFQVPRMPLRFPAMQEPLTLDAPFLGEHNAKILEALGHDADRCQELIELGVLGGGAT